MQSLFPIIRRVRRPLLVQDTPPVMVGNVEPVRADAQSQNGRLKMEDGGTVRQPVNANDAQTSEPNESQ